MTDHSERCEQMASKKSTNSVVDASRRKLLGGLAGLTAASTAGCLGSFGNDGGEGGSPDPVRDRVEVDPDDITEGGELVFGLGGGVDSFDPAYSTSAPASNAYLLVYESIVTTDAAGEVYPWLAESWSLEETNEVDDRVSAYSDYMADAETNEDGAIVSDGQIVVRDSENTRILTRDGAAEAVDDGTFGMRYRAELREGITFHNGEEMTAENVVGAYDVYANSDNAAQTFDSFLHAERVDDYTVDIYAQVPDAEAESQLPVEVYPSEHIENYPDTGKDPRNDVKPIGTGPYQLDSFTPEESAEFSKFGDYWLEDLGLDSVDWWDGPDGFPDGPVLDSINIRMVTDDATRAAALNNGELDLTYGLSTDTYSDYREDDGFRLSVTNAGAYNFLQFPVTQEPWNSQKLRRGVNQLIPRETIAENVYNGYRNPAWAPLPEMAKKAGTQDYDTLTEDSRELTEQDVEAATELIQEAIDEMGVETPIEGTIETNQSDDRVREVELIAQAMNQTDLFDINVETFEFNAFVGRILGPEYYKEGKLAFIGLSGTFNPGSFYDAVNDVANWQQCCNFNRVDTPELSDIADEARFSVDAVESEEFRGEKYDEVWQGLLEQVPNAYTVFGTNVAALSSDYKGHNTYTFSSSILPYGIHAPQDQQVSYLDR